MGILIGLVREMRYWDRASKIALGIGLVLLAISLYVLSTAPALRTPALVSSIGLLIAVQVIVLWGNRTMVTPYTQAQRHFLAGEFEQARDVLEGNIQAREDEGKKRSVKTLVLLGNTYRNLGLLDESEATLREALQGNATSPFALYGLGKTQLARGDYHSAVQTIDEALSNGAPNVIRFDTAHAYYRAGDDAQAIDTLDRVAVLEEPYRELFASYMRYRLEGAPAPTVAQISSGLPFWEAEVERFVHTPYGQALREDVEALRVLL